MILPDSRLESAGHAQLRTCIAKFGYLAKSDANTDREFRETHIRGVDFVPQLGDEVGVCRSRQG